jgi:hypothetical protein
MRKRLRAMARIVRSTCNLSLLFCTHLAMIALTLSIGGSASLTGTVQAHIIPRVDLGVNVLSGLASASVFLQLDGYGSLDMSLSVEGAASTSVLPSAPAKTMAETGTETLSLPAATTTETSSEEIVAPTEQPSSDSSEAPSSTESSDAASPTSSSDAKMDDPSTETTPTSTADIVAATDSVDPYVPEVAELSSSPQVEDFNVTEPIDNGVSTSPHRCPTGRRHPRHKRRDLVLNRPRDNVNFGGCVGVEMGVKIVAGAQGKLLSFWKDSTTVDLFGQSWKIFEVRDNHSSPHVPLLT